MANPKAPDFFNEEASKSYDERNKKLSAIGDGMHFLIRLVLNDLPEKARVLCVGVGTGAEIFSLAEAFPQWTFVGVDPSASMLEVCRKRLTDAGLIDRCQLVNGYVSDLPSGGDFDAALSVLVGHFIPRAERTDYFRNLTSRLRVGGTLVNTEISFDLQSPETDEMIEQWKKIQQLMGGTPESLAAVPKALREVLHVLPPEETERVMKEAGVKMPIQFFQSFMIHGWFGKK